MPTLSKIQRGRLPSSPLREIAHARGLRLTDVAAIAGLSTARVTRLASPERGHTSRISDLLRVAYAIGVAPTDLWPALAWRPPRPARLGHSAVVGALRGDRLELVSASDEGDEATVEGAPR